jgi:hypothetical protein
MKIAPHNFSSPQYQAAAWLQKNPKQEKIQGRASSPNLCGALL